MKQKIHYMLCMCLLIFSIHSLHAQIGADDANALIGLTRATDIAEINAINNPKVGSIVYNNTDSEIYRYTGATNGWQKATDDQNTDEVNTLSSTSDLNGDGNVDNTDIIDTDGDGIAETTVQGVLEAITPITSKAGRVFYPPSIEINASAVSTADESIDLYQQYVNQYDINSNTTTINGTTVNYVTAKSTSAPNNIPLYQRNELYYYITYADSSVFDIISLSDTGILTFRILAIPSDYNTIINVVFVVK